MTTLLENVGHRHRELMRQVGTNALGSLRGAVLERLRSRGEPAMPGAQGSKVRVHCKGR